MIDNKVLLKQLGNAPEVGTLTSVYFVAVDVVPACRRRRNTWICLQRLLVGTRHGTESRLIIAVRMGKNILTLFICTSIVEALTIPFSLFTAVAYVGKKSVSPSYESPMDVYIYTFGVKE